MSVHLQNLGYEVADRHITKSLRERSGTGKKNLRHGLKTRAEAQRQIWELIEWPTMSRGTASMRQFGPFLFELFFTDCSILFALLL